MTNELFPWPPKPPDFETDGIEEEIEVELGPIADKLCIKGHTLREFLRGSGLNQALWPAYVEAVLLRMTDDELPVGRGVTVPTEIGNIRDSIQEVEISNELGAELFNILYKRFEQIWILEPSTVKFKNEE